MQSIVRKKSYGSVKIFLLDRDLLIKEIRKAVRQLTAERPEVLQVILFGSVALDRALPSSDIDIMIVVTDCGDRFIDRPSKYLPYFEDIPLGVDCFVYTRDEIADTTISIVTAAYTHGIDLFNRNK